MNRYSWYTTKQKRPGGWYECNAIIVFPGNTLKFESYPFYKPNRKGNNKAKRNKAFNNGMRSIYGRKWADVKRMRSIYGRKWADVKRILKNTTEFTLKDIRGFKDSQHLTELLLTPTPIFEFNPSEY